MIIHIIIKTFNVLHVPPSPGKNTQDTRNNRIRNNMIIHTIVTNVSSSRLAGNSIDEME